MRMTNLALRMGIVFLAAAIGSSQAGVTPGGPPPPRTFLTALTGAEEVPPVDTNAFGFFQASANRNETELSFTLITVGLQDILAAHIHIAPAGQNGSVAAFLFNSGGNPVTTNGLLSRGTITADDLIGPLAGMTIADLLDEIRSGNAYVNVHTSDHSGGEIRGQIH